ncbi:penicillin-binding protein [Niastella yeongjuensis]|uniref:Penicillin-binding protein n=1 Tax=Niastella yeongjuensis TaxID=354355 RepID=A0A1V9FC97_9BACT|nr:PASTA domain-containing protein [Niastella yeongjuensis]OQP55806.1 penicillin-binding protein [Niastella yeongjuensis]SEP47564.1 PASTA domain-containing protein [Niastella yeongjuensis]
MFKFITGKPLWANILLGIGILLVLFFVFLQSLSWITRHDKTLAVPSVTGKSYDEAKKVLERQGFDVEIQDTVYNDTAALQSVVKQFPTADTKVKMNRTVYLTINRNAAPDIEMPKLTGLSFRGAEITLQQQKLKLEDTIYAPYFARDMVLEQHYKGQQIKEGTKIPMGSSITLVLGRGEGTEQFEVPDLFGMSYNEAKVMLESNGLTLGTVQPTDADPNGYVYKQNPARLTISGTVNHIKQGQFIDLWIQTEKPVRDSTAQGQ